ncbi:hypothetical protein HDU76_010214, partial [Blyttiomyces sp. JEL0837]
IDYDPYPFSLVEGDGGYNHAATMNLKRGATLPRGNSAGLFGGVGEWERERERERGSEDGGSGSGTGYPSMPRR